MLQEIRLFGGGGGGGGGAGVSTLVYGFALLSTFSILWQCVLYVYL